MRGHRSELDGLRGLAIALVVGYHAGYLVGGTIGVSLFFALSGYLITGNLTAELARDGRVELRRFYRRRVARLAPALLAALAAVFVLYRLMHLEPDVQLTLGVLMVIGYAGNVALGLLPTIWAPEWSWSLSLEEQFYLLWPAALILAWRRLRPRQLGCVLVCLAGAVALLRMAVTASSPSAGYFLVRGDEILLGCAAVLFAWRPSRVVTFVGAVAVLALSVSPLERVSLVMAVASVACVVAVAGAGHLRRVLAWRPLMHLGRISYGLYLWHSLLREPIWVLTQSQPTFSRMPALTFVTWLVASLLAAEGSTWLLERPLQRLLREKRRVVAAESPASSTAAPVVGVSPLAPVSLRG